MKIFKLMAIALVAMFGFTACDNEPEHIYDDHSADLVGTWSCFTENYAEVLIINADGSAVSYGVEDGEYWENVRGTVTVKENNITMIFEDDDNFTGHFDIIPGQAFSLFEDTGERYTYQYCANDLADEIVGMWVSNNGPTDMDNEIQIRTYGKDGIVTTTGVRTIDGNAEWILKEEREYKVVGNLLFKKLSESVANQVGVSYNVEQLIYTPKATALGDIMTVLFNLPIGDGFMQTRSSFLRVKQSLDLTGKTYDYSTAYVTSAKGKDEDFTIMGNTFNIAKIKAYDFDKMFSANLFCVELNANSFKYKLRLDNGQYTGFDTPMTIDGNKVTLDMSAINPALRKVEMHMFQDANDTQVHFYMHTDAFINYFANMEVYTLIMEGKINPADSTAVAKVFADMEARVESINVSFVMKARK